VRLGDVPLRNGFVIVVAIFLLLAVAPLRSGLDAVGRALPIPTRLAIVLGALAIAAISVGGLIVDPNIRKVVAATAVAIVMYQVLARIGAWRWAAWDEAERSIARRRSSAMFRRWKTWLEFLLLGSIAIATAVAIGLGRPGLLGDTGVALGVLLAGFIIGDVVGRNPAPPAVRRPQSATGARTTSSPSLPAIDPKVGE
jgi:hypothetical protein